MDTARCYGAPVETSYTELYNKIKLEILETGGGRLWVR
jgi:hypothetical protein